MNSLKDRATCLAAVALLTAGLLIAAPALAQPVSLSTSYTGAGVPGGKIVAKVTITANQGTTVQTVQWKQTGGVEATIGAADTRNPNVRLGKIQAYRAYLIHVLREPPVTQAQLPENVQIPVTEDGEFPGGLPNRFQIVGINPFALEEAGLVVLQVTVKTSSGTYKANLEIHTTLPWGVSTGVHNVPVDAPVLLFGRDQDVYNWTLAKPAGSKAALRGKKSQQPYFTPDVPGRYVVSVRDRVDNVTVDLDVYAGNYRGVIVGQDMDGRPVSDRACTSCHTFFAPDKFTPWAQTGHAEILTDNLNTSTHYSASCFPCHSVGFSPGHENGGFDDAPDFGDFMGAGLLNNPGDNWAMMLDEFPESARLANIQCENCHGPQEGELGADNEAHGGSFQAVGKPRTDLSADVCGSCHGEPLRHARFQQWQLSGHANYELAVDEGDSGSCSRCHTANGFLKWLPILLGDEPGNPTANISVDWDPAETHPQTCATCHDPHAIGTTTGIETNATVRISGDTPELIAGFKAVAVGRGAICMTCHNSRRGLKNDATFGAVAGTSEVVRAPHGSSQTDVLLGENAYGVNVGVRGSHGLIADTCVTCHMEATPPPDVLSYNLGGTNHTFFASPDICERCHEEITANVIQGLTGAILTDVKKLIEDKYQQVIQTQIDAGYKVDLNGEMMVTSAQNIARVEFGESHGRQALTVVFANGTARGPYPISDIDVIRPTPLGTVGLHVIAGDDLGKAGWNWNLINNDGSKGVHNPRFALTVLDAARDAAGGLGGSRAVDRLDALNASLR